eukprot:TRINITY_DN3464_c0_g1_i2.p1 TRINITY_DN3464_c0_g1~~TRINITY_DN3464_c0_g1_i2.p1  ORF type:complete len:403 (+),score=90.77 TRINITY_DN3464_c0_g1_i2:183-1211(+)
MQHAQTGLRIAGGVAGIAMLAAMTAGTGGVGLVAVGVAAGGATIVALGAGAVAICLGIRAAHVTYRGVKGLQHYARRLRAQKLLRQEEMAKWRAGVIAGEIAKQTRYPRPVPESERQPFRIDSAAYSFGIGWDAKGRVDADLAAVVFDESGVIVCVVNGLGESLSFADGAISHTGDDKLGGKESRMRCDRVDPPLPLLPCSFLSPLSPLLLLPCFILSPCSSSLSLFSLFPTTHILLCAFYPATPPLLSLLSLPTATSCVHIFLPPTAPLFISPSLPPTAASSLALSTDYLLLSPLSPHANSSSTLSFFPHHSSSPTPLLSCILLLLLPLLSSRCPTFADLV